MSRSKRKRIQKRLYKFNESYVAPEKERTNDDSTQPPPLQHNKDLSVKAVALTEHETQMILGELDDMDEGEPQTEFYKGGRNERKELKKGQFVKEFDQWFENQQYEEIDEIEDYEHELNYDVEQKCHKDENYPSNQEPRNGEEDNRREKASSGYHQRSNEYTPRSHESWNPPPSRQWNRWQPEYGPMGNCWYPPPVDQPLGSWSIGPSQKAIVKAPTDLGSVKSTSLKISNRIDWIVFGVALLLVTGIASYQAGLLRHYPDVPKKTGVRESIRTEQKGEKIQDLEAHIAQFPDRESVDKLVTDKVKFLLDKKEPVQEKKGSSEQVITKNYREKEGVYEDSRRKKRAISPKSERESDFNRKSRKATQSDSIEKKEIGLILKTESEQQVALEKGSKKSSKQPVRYMAPLSQPSIKRLIAIHPESSMAPGL